MSSTKTMEYVEGLAEAIYSDRASERVYRAALWRLDLLNDHERSWLDIFRTRFKGPPERVRFQVYRLALENEDMVLHPLASLDTPLRAMELIEEEARLDPEHDYDLVMVDSLTGSCLYDSSDPYHA